MDNKLYGNRREQADALDAVAQNAERGMSMSDTEFMTHIISEICNYAVENGMEPDDTLGTIADNILSLLEISTFNNWKLKGE